MEMLIGTLQPDLPMKNILDYEGKDTAKQKNENPDKLIINQLKEEISRFKSYKCQHCLMEDVNIKYPYLK